MNKIKERKKLNLSKSNFITYLKQSVFIVIILILTSYFTVDIDKTFATLLNDKNYEYLEVGANEHYDIGYHNLDDFNIDKDITQNTLSYIDGGYFVFQNNAFNVSKMFIVDADNNQKELQEIYNVADNEIIITDYVAINLLNNASNNSANYNELIGKDIYYSGHYLKVSRIIFTHYEDDPSLDLINLKNFYNSVFINKNTFTKLIYHNDLIVENMDFYNKQEMLFNKASIKIIPNSNLIDNKVIISKDIATSLPSETFDVHMCTSKVKFECIINDVLDDDTTNTIYVSNELLKTISENRCVINTIIDVFQNDKYIEGLNIYNVKIYEGMLSDDEIKISSDLSNNVSGEIELRLTSPVIDKLNLEINITGTVEDENNPNTIYVNKNIYKVIQEYLLGGGVVVKVNSNNYLKYVSLLNENDMFFHTPFTKQYIKLSNNQSNLLIPFISIMVVSFLIYLLMLIVYVNNNFKVQNQYSKLKTDKKIISKNIIYVIIGSYILGVLIFLHIPKNNILENLYFVNLKISLLETLIWSLAIPVLSLIIVYIYMKIRDLRLKRVSLK